MNKFGTKYNLQPFFFSLIVILSCIGFALFCARTIRGFWPSWEKALFSREPIEMNNFEHLWTLEDVFINARDRAIYMAANDKQIAIHGALKSYNSPTQISIESSSGEIISAGMLGTNGMFGIPSYSFGIANAAYDSEYMYLGFDGGGQVTSDSKGNAGGVAAYDMNSGEIVWTQIITGTGTMHSLMVGQGVVSVYGGGPWGFYLIDSADGTIIHVLENGVGKTSLASDSPAVFAVWYDYISKSGNHEETGNIPNINFWRERFHDVSQPPILFNDLLLVKRNEMITDGIKRAGNIDEGTAIGSIVLLDGETGETIWETENNVISNVAKNESTAFYLTTSAELVALDLYTGQKMGSVQFMISEIQLGSDRGYFVAAADDTVFAYFGDSRQLFSFHFSP